MMLSRRVTPVLVLALAMSSAGWAQQDRAAQIPFDYDVRLDQVYVQRTDWNGKLDLYLPSSRTSATPVVVWFHGGGWTRSSKEQELLYVLPYLYRQWAVVNVEYRLADVAKAPGAASDGLCAMRWLSAHAQQYKLRLDNLVISGISAGGTMALIAGTMPASSPLARDCGPDRGFGELPEPRVIVNWFGPSNLVDLIEGPNRQEQVASWFAGVPNRLEIARALSPVMYINSKGPAVITIHGEQDRDVPYGQSVALHSVLEKVGTANRLVRVRAAHGDFTPAQAASAFDSVFEYISERFRK